MKLKLRPHSTKPDEEMIELWRDDVFIAAIYATPRGVKIVSKYINNHSELIQIDPAIPPAILVNIT